MEDKISEVKVKKPLEKQDMEILTNENTTILIHPIKEKEEVTTIKIK